MPAIQKMSSRQLVRERLSSKLRAIQTESKPKAMSDEEADRQLKELYTHPDFERVNVLAQDVRFYLAQEANVVSGRPPPSEVICATILFQYAITGDYIEFLNKARTFSVLDRVEHTMFRMWINHSVQRKKFHQICQKMKNKDIQHVIRTCIIATDKLIPGQVHCKKNVSQIAKDAGQRLVGSIQAFTRPDEL
jgi:hypothetical protein